ncbi:MAG TPA: DUF4118 domain-containing protein [Tepidisphaeraceae bacterium]|nr:DUF4118 domain-containing protein [Tepidisphaeraceae bacterium]
MPDRRDHGYLVAAAATAAMLLVRLALGHIVDAASPFLFFAPAVMIGAWYGGRGPGLVATAAGAMAANYFLLAPTGSFSIASGDVTKMVVFLIVGGQISWLSGALFDAKRLAESDAEGARRSEQLYRTLAHNFPNGAVFLLDNGMRIALAEGRAISVSGIAGDKLRGVHLTRAFPRRALVAIAALLRSEEKQKGTFLIPGESGNLGLCPNVAAFIGRT